MKRVATALIREDDCIGCKRCIDACPVDAIVGAAGLMHTVVESWCIGCELCLPPCPVDCIDMVAPQGAWTSALRRAESPTWEELSALLFALPGWSKAGFNARNRIVLCTLLQLEKCSYGTGVLLGL